MSKYLIFYTGPEGKQEDKLVLSEETNALISMSLNGPEDSNLNYQLRIETNDITLQKFIINLYASRNISNLENIYAISYIDEINNQKIIINKNQIYTVNYMYLTQFRGDYGQTLTITMRNDQDYPVFEEL